MRKDVWDRHWTELGKKGQLAGFTEFYRRRIIANTVKHYCDKYFPEKGVFLDAGCGTGQASQHVSRKKRHLVGLDVSIVPLFRARHDGYYDSFVRADAANLPFKSASLGGIWNVGVMEHMHIGDIEKSLGEFHRVLKKGSYCILFWPPKFDLYFFVIKPFEKIMGVFRRGFQLYPKEITNAKSKKEMREIVLKHSSFSDCKVFHTAKDLFTHYAVVCRK